MTAEFKKEILTLPKFSAGNVVRETDHFRVVMDYKRGLRGLESAQRFFIEPLSDDAEKILELAASAHNVPNLEHREVKSADQIHWRKSLRADFIVENLQPLLYGVTEKPEEGLDSIPSPDRMEKCLALHPDSYTFSD